MMNILSKLLLILIIASCSVSKSTKTMHPFSGESVGCGNFIIYKLAEDNKEYVSVVVDVSTIELEPRQSYGIGKSEVVKVTRKKYDSEISTTLCNDVMPNKRPKELLEELASDGTVELVISPIELEKAKKDEPYKATVILRKVVFETVSIDYLRLENINVGWLPG
ncbi:hypothetical protein [Ekhidna sp. To15]|uniref:hypothetical protein n=1 Tax=Ekhidna sp. To15 TaxID=3395267 RepID=UPI003F52136B